MGNIKDFIIGLLISGLFVICILGFASGIASIYNKPDIMHSEYIDTSRLEAQVNKTSENAQAWGNAFKSDNIFVATGAIVLFSIWGIFTLIWDSIITFIVIYFDLVSNLLGIPPIVTGTVTAIVIISLIFLGWKLLKQGE